MVYFHLKRSERYLRMQLQSILLVLLQLVTKRDNFVPKGSRSPVSAEKREEGKGREERGRGGRGGGGGKRAELLDLFLFVLLDEI
jgi:hypothetical protein